MFPFPDPLVQKAKNSRMFRFSFAEVKTSSLERQRFSPGGQVEEENHNKSLEKIENGSDKLQVA